MAGDELTCDTLFAGRLRCSQYKQGYRFSVDALLAAHFCRPGPTGHILDLGCGNGIIGLILAFRHPRIRVTGLEVQPDLARLAEANIRANSLEGRMAVLPGSLRGIAGLVPPESFDLVVCNPPYRQSGSGRQSPADQRARARHEIDASLADVVQAAAFAVKNRGNCVVVYPASRSVALIAALKAARLEPKRLQPVYGHPASPEAALVLVEAMKNGGEEVQLLPPFYTHAEQDGPFSPAMQALYE